MDEVKPKLRGKVDADGFVIRILPHVLKSLVLGKIIN